MINNAEFVLSVFIAKYFMQNYRFPHTQAQFSNVKVEEGDPVYTVSGRICLDGKGFLTALLLEQQTLRITVRISAVLPLSDTEEDCFDKHLEEMNRALPIDFEVALKESRPVFTHLIHKGQTPCSEEELIKSVGYTVTLSAAFFNTFRCQIMNHTESSPPTELVKSCVPAEDTSKSTKI